MSKKRLEEITLEEIKRFYDGTATVYIAWLIKRVQELEDILDQDHRQEVLEGMYEENKRYREIIQDFIDHAEDYNVTRVEKYNLRKALEGGK